MLLSARTLKVDMSVDTDIMSVSAFLFGGTIHRDRFNLLNNLSNIMFDLDKTDPIPPRTDKPFAQIVDEQACKYIEASGNQRIAVLWSGGVDSTCVVSTFIRNGIPKEKLLVVGTKSESLEKSYYFYEFLVKNGYEVLIVDELSSALCKLQNCAYLISGAGGDQLCMHEVHRYDISLYDTPFYEGAKGLFEAVGLPLTKKSLDYFCEVWRWYAKALDIDLKCICDFTWLYNFAIRFNTVKDRERLLIIQSENAKKYTPFFMDIDFQSWALSHYEEFREYHQTFDRYHYKWPFKEITYSVVKNRECFQLGKHCSRTYSYEDMTDVLVNDTEGIRIYRVPDSKYYEQAAQYVANMYRKRPALL